MSVDISHFSMAGFAVDMADGRALQLSTAPLLPQCRYAPLPEGLTLCTITDKSGAELRVVLHVAPNGGARLVTMNPAFAGTGRADVEIGADVSDPDYRTTEIALSAHFAGETTPIVFELADPAEAPIFHPGAKLTVDIAAFSFNARIFPDEKAFDADQRADGVTDLFSADFFVPTGTYTESKGGAMPDGTARPVAYADLAGTVVSARLQDNTVGGRPFWSVVLRGHDGATFDVVLDPREVSAPVTQGEIVAGRFWLSARVAP